MLTMPKLIDRPAEPYLAIRLTTSIGELPVDAPKTIHALYTRLGERGIPPGRPLLFRYRSIVMPGPMEIDVGLSMPDTVENDPVLVADELPAGRYASVLHRGPYEELYDVNAVLIGWAKERSIRFDVEEGPSGDRFAGRAELYRIGPESGSDPTKWETELVIRVADGA